MQDLELLIESKVKMIKKTTQDRNEERESQDLRNLFAVKDMLHGKNARKET